MSPADLNPVQVLLACWSAGAVLSRDGGDIHVEANKGGLPCGLLEALRANKRALLAILPVRSRKVMP